MKVILLEDIEALGKMGDTVMVKDGYARNYLIPRKLALLATARNLKAQDHQIRDMERRKAKITGDAQSLADKITGVSVSFTRKTGEKGRLFGSVTNMDIAEALKEKGLDINRKNIILPEPIKSLGEFDIEIKLHHDVIPVVKITVLPEDGEIPEGAMEEAPGQEAAPESPEAVEKEEVTEDPAVEKGSF
ncbi:MAG: 50S ribosomal protein L9 [bacterium]|nr:50S ribosomal protein L9 [bacterium]MDT8366025.1 50S ribosomal protein L9 [bacterium]